MDFDIGALHSSLAVPGEHPVKDHPQEAKVEFPNVLDEHAISIR